MIIYKTTSNKWRIPRSIVRKNTSTNQFVPSENVRKKDGTIAWHRNQLNAYSGTPTAHPYWQYSMNPQFLINENNYFAGLDSALEICFGTGLSNPGGNGRYTAGLGEGTIYATQSQSNGLSDCILNPKFSLNVAGGSKYRSQVSVKTTNGRSPLGPITARWWRLIIDGLRDNGAANSVQLSEFYLLGNNGNSITGATYTSSNNSPPGEGASNAGDGSTATKWLSFDKIGSILTITFASGVNVTGYRWATANDEPNRDPVSWRLQYSTDNVNWVTASTIVNYFPTTNRQTYVPDFNMFPTILTGFWTNTTQDGADFFQAGVATEWSPAVGYTRTVDLNDIRSPAQALPVWNASTKVLTWDVTINASHSWARPIIKIESTSTATLPINYVINQWWVYRIS